jgi:hypothetical protein
VSKCSVQRDSAARTQAQPASHRCLPPEPHPTAQQTLLKLQRTAGNTAALALLSSWTLQRQPQPTSSTNELAATLRDFFDPLRRFWQELEVRRDYEEGRVRYEEARKRQRRRLKETEEHEKPHVLKSAGVESTTIVDEHTEALIQAALTESRLLRPYLKNKFPGARIPGAKFKIHDSNEEFEYSYAKLHNIRDSPAAVHAQVARINGFFHRPTATIHLRPRSTLGDAVHEAIHKLASPTFKGYFGRFWDEGVAQYFADRVLAEHRLARYQAHLYERNLRCAKQLVAFAGDDAVAAAYFVDSRPLVESLTAKLGVDLGALIELISRGTLCDRLR